MESYVTFEHWVRVKGHPNYEISNFGRVRNRRTGRVLVPVLNRKGGYYRVKLDGVRYYVHRLVLLSFFNMDGEGLDVNHIDGDKLNNHLTNLEWVTRKENIRHAHDNDLVYVRVVRCKYCIHRDTNPFCRDRPDYFYCAEGEL